MMFDFGLLPKDYVRHFGSPREFKGILATATTLRDLATKTERLTPEYLSEYLIRAAADLEKMQARLVRLEGVILHGEEIEAACC